ncbi:hypothetical protein Aglo03_44650 [Actinokineospora globicatena]|uniref:Uncharacterized protein n=1 Tax=Actinokineospora globicatena TaxID=103729 RepID=A0A9W6VB57_9PSEU|nr:hypothetical protein Aglo03_44650 [Actinokineospora globicatena]
MFVPVSWREGCEDSGPVVDREEDPVGRTRSMRAPLLAGRGPLAKVPPAAAFLVVVGLFVTAVLVRGTVGALLLGVLAVGVGVLLAGTWRVLAPAQRVGRVLVLGLLVAVAVSVL